jgi:hypothetical protein
LRTAIPRSSRYNSGSRAQYAAGSNASSAAASSVALPVTSSARRRDVMAAGPATVFESPCDVASCMGAFLLTRVRDRPRFAMKS